MARGGRSGRDARVTRASAALDAAGVPHQLIRYPEVDEIVPDEIAARVGLPVDAVCKTLAVEGERAGACFCVVPIAAQLDLKAIAALRGEKKVQLVPLARLEALTGYRRGSVTVFGAKRQLDVLVDDRVTVQQLVGISGGAPGCEILVRPDDLVRASGATVASIVTGR